MLKMRMFVVAPLVVLVLVFFTLVVLLFSVDVGGAMGTVVLDRVGRTVPPPPLVVLTGTDTGVGSIVGDGGDRSVVGFSDWTMSDGGRLLLGGSVVTVLGTGD
jgi:hypothetical protein